MASDPFIEELANEGGLPQDTYETLTADNTFVETNGAEGEWLDGDTIKFGEERVRIAGIDTRETNKVRPDGSYKPGEVGGYEQAAKISDLARKKGYTTLQDTGEVDPYGRKIMDLTNAAGSKFSDELTATGVVRPNRYTRQDAIDSSFAARAYRNAIQNNGEAPTDMQAAADWIDQMIDEQGGEYSRRKLIAFDEQELAQAKHAGIADAYIQDDVQIRNQDRYYDNKAKNPLSTAWDSGWQGVVEGGTGFLNLVGEETGWEGLADWADAKGDVIRDDLARQPEIILDYKDALQNPDGSWPKNPIEALKRTDEFIEYVGNMAAMSLPYMAITMGGAALAPVTGGLSMTAPAAVYAGQTWNEMEGEKNALLAIGAGISMAALDRLGIAGIANTSVISREGREAVLNQLVSKGMTRDQAANALVKTTRQEAAKLSGDAVKFAKSQITARETLKGLLRNAARGTATEGLTEVGQESIGYLAAVHGSDKKFDANEMLDRITNAAIGGGILGAGFTVPGTAYNTGAWTDVAYRLAPADTRRQSLQNQWAEQEIKENGRIQSHAEILANAEKDANRRAQTGNIDQSINARAARDEKRKKGRAVGEVAEELWEGVPGLWRGATRHIFNTQLQTRSPAARKIASLFSGQLDQMYSGATFENAKHLKLAEYKNIMSRPGQVLEAFGFDGKKVAIRKDMQKVSDMIYGAYQRSDGNWEKLRNDPDYGQHVDALIAFDKEARMLTDKVFADSKKHNPKLEKLKDYVYRHKSMDKRKIEGDTRGFEKDLMDRFGLPEAEAVELTNKIITQNDPFSLTELGGLKPASHKGRTLNLSDDPVFAKKWLNDSIFDNLSDVAKTGARFEAYQNFLGEDNKKLGGLLTEMENELLESGMDKDEARKQTDKAARGMRDYLDAESGNYKRPKTSMGRTLQAYQKNFMFFTMMASLPLATLSSFVEFALTYRALEGSQVADMSKHALKEAKGMVDNFWSEKDFETQGRDKLRDLGFMEWEVGAATVTGATEISARKQQWSDAYFKSIGLKQWTDYTRAMRGAIAQDFIVSKLETLANAGPTRTNEEATAEEALRGIGINTQDAIEIYQTPQEALTPEQIATQEQMFRDATFQFINDAVVLPQAALRPLFYQDPRFALFTQFHGFISTFQANHLPKLYRQAFKGGTPAMKYNAFAVMASMILLGFLSQYLKDLLKFGQATPYLDTGEKIQRGVGASGLLGTVERPLNLINPLYESRYDSTPEWAFDTVTGESAAISKGKEVVSAADKFLEGDPNKGLNKALKFAPWLGPFNGARGATADWFFEENKDG